MKHFTGNRDKARKEMQEEANKNEEQLQKLNT
jgi:hypothetical protein